MTHGDFERGDEERLSQLLGELKNDARARPGFHASVMRAVAEVPASPWRRLTDWWLRPRTLHVTPAWGALAVAALAAVVLWPGARPSDDLVGTPPSATQQLTRFVLVAPGASSVHLTGDFMAWNREGIVLADPRGTGVWTADVPLPPGVYQYTFVIDGTEWVPDPRAVSQVDDGFGQLNSVLIVPGGSEA